MSNVEQDTLKDLLKKIVYLTEKEQLTSLDDVVQKMLYTLRELPSSHRTES